MATGNSPGVLTLANQLSGEVQAHAAISDTLGTEDRSAEANTIIVKLPLSNSDDAIVLAETEQWLQRHSSILGSTEARKILEFSVFLDSNTGSRILTIPNSIVALCGNLRLDLASQAIRVLTKSEYNAIRDGKK